MQTMNTSINSKEYFSNYILNSTAQELSKNEKLWITLTSIAIGILSVGIVHLACYVAFKNQRISLLNRYNDPNDTTKRIEFLAMRLQNNLTNQPTKNTIKELFKDLLTQAEKTESPSIQKTQFDVLKTQLHTVEFILKEQDTMLQDLVGEVRRVLDERLEHKINSEVNAVLEDFKIKTYNEKLAKCEKLALETKDWDFVDISEFAEILEEIYPENIALQRSKILEFSNSILNRSDLTDKLIAHAIIGLIHSCKKILNVEEIERLFARLPPDRHWDMQTRDLIIEELDEWEKFKRTSC